MRPVSGALLDPLVDGAQRVWNLIDHLSTEKALEFAPDKWDFYLDGCSALKAFPVARRGDHYRTPPRSWRAVGLDADFSEHCFVVINGPRLTLDEFQTSGIELSEGRR